MRVFKCAPLGGAGTHDSRLGFTSEGSEYWKKWDRFLTIDGKKAYHIGNICQTCNFFFERLGGANTSINVESAVETLALGVRTISDPVVAQIANCLPQDDYLVCLSEAVPNLVFPGHAGDYFVKEQVALWGIDPFYNLPHDPRVPYYRAGEKNLGSGAMLFHLIIPMFPENWLKRDVVSSYASLIQDGGTPSAVTLSILDVKGPADWEGEIDPTEHWVLSHYVIDGHHKLAAARELEKPLRLLNFISISNGVSTKDQVERAVGASLADLP
ncbi:hypothetical protein DYQ86_09150 [Acidobacteria bacterium AB60]|nr:hypothetical protein DYQ86_09150 [Acidobacteria bacterium AB60]